MVNTIRTTERVVDVDEALSLASQPERQSRVKAGQTQGSASVGSGVAPGGRQTAPTGGQGMSVYGQGQTGYYLDPEPQQPEPQQPADESFVIGVPYFLPFATQYRDSWEVYRDDIVTIRQLNTMRREDGQARALYRLLTMPIRAALKDSTFQPRDESGQKEADFITDMYTLPPTLGGMEISFNRVIAQMLLSIFEGFSAFEMVYWCPEKGPLKGKWTPRRLDWRPSETLTFLLDGTGTWDGFRQRCLTADTKVSQLDGTEIRIDEMVRRHEAGQEQWVYSCTENGKVVPGKVKLARKTSDSEKLVEVELDNGEKVRCTLTHPWMMKDGSYKRAAVLEPGDSLMPLYRRFVRPSSLSKLAYEKVTHPGTGKVEWTHWVSARGTGQPPGRGYVIHHGFDGLGYRNNDPRNLTRMTQAEHMSLHNRLSKNGGVQAAHDWWMGLSSEERSRLSSERALKRWQDPEYRAGGSGRLAGARAATDPERWGHRRIDITFELVKQTARELLLSGEKARVRDVGQKLGCSQDVLYARVRAAGFDGWGELLCSLKNHKVVAVRSVEPEAVYDIEVEGWHNFALSAGVFVHNTFFNGRSIDAKIEAKDAFYVAMNEEERPFYGVSMFETAFFHYDKKCVAGDMKVSLLDGTEVEVRELARRCEAGEVLWLYGCRDGKVVPGKVGRVWRTGVKRTVQVTLDNGEVVKCTPDHRIMLRDGSWREAGQLRSGDSLMPLYRRRKQISQGSQEYEQVYNPATGRWVWTHRMVARELGFEARRGEVIHHGFDGLCHLNNDPRNLTRMTGADHMRLHSEGMRERWRDPEFRRLMASLDRPAMARKMWERLTPEKRAEWVAASAAARRADVSMSRVLELVSGGVTKRVDVASALGVSDVTLLKRVREAGHQDWQSFVRSCGAEPAVCNGAEKRRRFSLEDIEAAYEQAAGDKGYATLAELTAVLDCTMLQVYRTLEYAGQGSFGEWRERRVVNNHKVVSVESGPVTEVYDLEVPGVENFALSAGVFAHNCKLYYITHLAAQRAAVGTRIGTMPPNPMKRDKEMFVSGLKQLGLAQYMIVPSADWTVTNLKEEGSFDFLGLINHHNSQMSKSVLQAWFDDQQGTGGDTTLVDFGKQSDATGIMLLEAIMDDLKWVVDNKITPKFIDWNFGSENYPEFHWGPLTAEQKAAIQDTFDKLAAAGQNLAITKQFMLELEKKMAEDFGFDDIDYDTELKRLQAQQKMQDDLSKQQNSQALAESKFSVQNLQNPDVGAPGGGGAGQSAGGGSQGGAGSSAGQGSGGSGGGSQSSGGGGGSSSSGSTKTQASSPPDLGRVQLTDEQRLEALDFLMYDLLAPADQAR